MLSASDSRRYKRAFQFAEHTRIQHDKITLPLTVVGEVETPVRDSTDWTDSLEKGRMAVDGIQSMATMFVPEKRIWWREPNSVRIPLGIALAIAWGLGLRRIYTDVKNAPKRSPKVRRNEIIVATVLWSFIAVGVALLLWMAH